MIKVVCPGCKEEKGNYEVVKVAPEERRYEVRCAVCGTTYEVYGKDAEARAS